MYTICVKPMSHLQFYREILSRNFIARQSCSMQVCMSHTATLSHKQELTNQRSLHFRDKVAQNRALHSQGRIHGLKGEGTNHAECEERGAEGAEGGAV